MPRTLLVLLCVMVIWGSPGQLAIAQGGSLDSSVFERSRNPLWVQASRINPSEMERIADQLAKIVKGPPLPRTRPTISPLTQDERKQIRDNPLLSAAHNADAVDTALWLRKINQIIASGKSR